MYPKIESFQYHCGSPAISKLSRTPGYRIIGNDFGEKPGKVEIEFGDDDAAQSQHVKSWSDTYIEIDRPMPDPLGWGTWDNQVIVTAANGRRSKRFEIVRPSNPYVGYIRPQDRRALRQAA